MAELINVKERLNGDLPLYISNKIIEAHFFLPLGEQRLLYAYISKLSEDHTEFPELELSVKEFSEMLEVDLNYKAVWESCRALLKRTVEIETDEWKVGFQWFSLCQYKKKEGRLRLKIHDELKPYLLRLKKEFTRLITRQVMQFRSVYSIRIYMLCKQYQAMGKRLVNVEELKKKLGIEPGKYKQYADFKRRIIEQAQKEINSLSDIEIEFDEIKKARKVVELLFTISTNTRNEVREEGVHSMQLKSMAELAEMLIKEIRKRWNQELRISIISEYSKSAVIELLCAILSGGYDGKQIYNVNTYFKAALEAIERDLRERRLNP